MDIASLLFPQAPSYASGLLGEEEAKRLQGQARQAGLLNLGLGLLAAGGPAAVRPGLGQGLIQGLSAGQQAYQNVYSQRLQEMEMARKIAEQRQQQQMQQAVQQLGPQALAGNQDALSQLAQFLGPEQLAKFTTAAKTAQEMRTPAKPELREVGGALYEVIPGQAPKLIINAKNQFTGDAANAAISQFGTADVNLLTAEQRMQIPKLVESLRVAGRPSLTVQMGESATPAVVKRMIERTEQSQVAADAANQTISTINQIKPILESGVFSGPLSDQAQIVLRLGSTLGITGRNTQETLQRTAEAMQGLARLELQAAESMRGQGAITETERALIARAAGGNLATFTAGEVNVLLDALRKTAESKIKGHSRQVDLLRKTLPTELQGTVEAFTTVYEPTASSNTIRSQARSAAVSAGFAKE